jgi:hypothetical protein
MSPLMKRLREERAVCREPLRCIEIVAELAGCHARVGEIDEARTLVSMLREIDVEVGGQALVWGMFTEGLIEYFDQLGLRARDRMCRAHLLADSMGMMRLSSLAAAWLAHLDAKDGDIRSMVKRIQYARTHGRNEDLDVRIRVALVLADAFQLAEMEAEARHWYENARRLSSDYGDETSLGALMYNRATTAVSLINLSRLLGTTAAEGVSVRFVEMEAESSLAFQVGTDTTALHYLSAVCTARCRMLQQDYVTAVPLLAHALAETERLEDKSQWAMAAADLAWCHAISGDLEGARHVVSRIVDRGYSELAPEDQILVVARLRDTALALSDSSTSASWTDEFQALRAVCLDRLRESRLLLQSIG